MKQRLVQEQKLQWKINQSLLQSINILQFSSVELIEYIQEVSKENPLIEEVNYDYDIVQYRSQGNEQPAIGEINQTELSMYEQLKMQLYTLDIAEEIKPVVYFGIDSLNEDGYLDVDLDLWAKKCDTTIENTENALEMIQTLEPVGVGARTLSECIIIQLRAMGHTESFIENLLEDHLDWIAEEDIKAISDYYDVSETSVLELIKSIKSCHPKPGQLLVNQKPDYIIPEAEIYKEDGIWKISFYKWNSPKIELNQSYANFKSDDKKTREYLKEKYNQVDWLKQAISYRSNTLESIIQNVLEKQYTFFEYGTFMLRPLTLREIAADIDVHVSTVSRAINNKYIQTNQGVMPIKFFLQSGIRQASGKQTASIAVKQLILEIIQYENKAKPLSDEAIKKRLEGEFGITVARRTIMKYREQLQIPSSTKRK
ncbi:RNA polymerase factor sigma-54 [Virgibacillus ainsalahensis]